MRHTSGCHSSLVSRAIHSARVILSSACCYVSALADTHGATHSHRALIDDMPDLEPLQDMPTDEDVHYWTYRDDEEDKATVCAMLDAKDP